VSPTHRAVSGGARRSRLASKGQVVAEPLDRARSGLWRGTKTDAIGSARKRRGAVTTWYAGCRVFSAVSLLTSIRPYAYGVIRRGDIVRLVSAKRPSGRAETFP